MSLAGTVMSEHATPIQTAGSEVTAGGRVKQVVALSLFLVVGFIFTAPCLCVEGSTAGAFTMTLLLLAFSRLAWSVYKRTFRYRDCILYLAIVIAFSLWADLRLEH